jgi:hypothetical protein
MLFSDDALRSDFRQAGRVAMESEKRLTSTSKGRADLPRREQE